MDGKLSKNLKILHENECHKVGNDDYERYRALSFWSEYLELFTDYRKMLELLEQIIFENDNIIVNYQKSNKSDNNSLTEKNNWEIDISSWIGKAAVFVFCLKFNLWFDFQEIDTN